jgi:DNA repair protein RecO (recombination protein O)
MTRARIQLAAGYVLRAQPYRDSSQLIEAWTLDHGRVGLVARGSRSPKSRTRALLQPFQPLLLSWNEQGDLGTLTGAEAQEPPVPLAGETVFSGWYLNELLLKLLPRHDPHPELFEAYRRALARLPLALQPALREFEKCLLAELGYGLELPDDIDPKRRYRYDPELGPVPAFGNEPASHAGDSLIALRDGALATEGQLRDARRLLRAALRPLLGNTELESARLLRRLRSRPPSPS